MAKFTKADEIDVLQSVGHYTDGNPDESLVLQVFQPHQGRDLLYKNPKFNSGSTEITQSNDRRIPLGTYTLNNRDYWENNNFNESTFQSYVKDNLETHDTLIEETPDGPIVRTADDNIYYNHWLGYSWSIDALPFVINPNNDDIIHLDKYYDKEIDKEQYELATEGKINYYLSPRIHGRLGISGSGNIDIFTNRPLRTAGGKNYFEWNITGENSEALENLSDNTDGSGMYLFKLNWGDGSELEYTDKPQLLEPTTLFEHFYEKPGFYSITGVVYQIGDSGLKLRTWEKFETNILLNPSSNYELNLLDYTDFASIGGISKDSAFVKSLYNMVGISPLSIDGVYDNTRASVELIEELNEFDKIQLLNVLGKVDSEVIQPYDGLIEPYSKEIDDVPVEGFIEVAGAGCTDPNAINFDSTATFDDGTCDHSFEVELINVETEQNLNYISYIAFGSALYPADNLPGNLNLEEEGWWEDTIENQSEILSGTFPISLIQNTTGNTPKVFIKFTVGNNPPDGMVGLTDTQSNFSLLPTIVVDGTNDANELVFGWYRLVYNSEPGPENYGGADRLEEVNFQIDPEFTGDEEQDPPGDIVVEWGLEATLTGDNSNWFFLSQEGGSVDFNAPFGNDTPVENWNSSVNGWYHKHFSGKYHTGFGSHTTTHEVPWYEEIEQQELPVIEYTIVLHNSPLSAMDGTTYSKVRFPSSPPGVNTGIGIPSGFPTGGTFLTNDPDASGYTNSTLTLPDAALGSENVIHGGDIVTVEGEVQNAVGVNEWSGWYSDPELTNQLTSNNVLTFTVGTPPYGNPASTTIHLYAKASSGV